MKKVEIHVFPDKTSGSKSYKLKISLFICNLLRLFLSNNFFTVSNI